LLTTAMQLPSNVLSLARRTTSLSLVALGELSATAFPRMAGPADSIAWRAWMTGFADEPPVPSAAASRQTRIS
jgi:hypothetical protein